jgi:hypothetical protein
VGRQMESHVSSLFEALDKLLVGYEKWRKPLHNYLEQNLPRVNQGGSTVEVIEQGLNDLQSRLEREYDPHPEINRLIEGLCSAYLESDPIDRTEIRAHVARRQRLGSLVWSFANGIAATRIQGAHDAPQLKLGLAAISIENCNSDYRDTLVSLADLFVRTEEAGIDPRTAFAAVAEISTGEPTSGGCDSLASTMRDFETYAVLAERRGRGRSYQKW